MKDTTAATRTLPLQRCTLAYTEEGRGPAVVWAHGVLANTFTMEKSGVFDWEPLARAGVRLIRYDARGHGRSAAAANPDDFTFSVLADDLIALAGAVQPDAPIAAIGHSMGAATILHAALKAPSRFERLILTAAPTAWESRGAQASVYTEAADRIDREGEPAAQSFLASFPRAPIFNGLPGRAIEVGVDLIPSVLRGAARSDLPPPADLRRLEMPALILAWQGDPAHPLTTSERLAELLPNATLHVAKSLDEVHGWAPTIQAFLAR